MDEENHQILQLSWTAGFLIMQGPGWGMTSGTAEGGMYTKQARRWKFLGQVAGLATDILGFC